MFVVDPASKAMIVIFSTSSAVCAARRALASALLASLDRGARDAHFGARLNLQLLDRQLRRFEDRLALTAHAAPLAALENRLRQLQRKRPRARRLEEAGGRQQLRAECDRRHRPPILPAVVDDTLVRVRVLRGNTLTSGRFGSHSPSARLGRNLECRLAVHIDGAVGGEQHAKRFLRAAHVQPQHLELRFRRRRVSATSAVHSAGCRRRLRDAACCSRADRAPSRSPSG